MLSPIPGLSHLLYLAPDDTMSPSAAAPHSIPKEISALVHIALDSAFGLRPLTQLHPKRFGASTRAHVAARRKGAKGDAGAAADVVKIISMHVHLDEPRAEVFGSIRSRQRATAYAAGLVRTDGIWRMSSFRVL